jgi:hypothetical protein
MPEQNSTANAASLSFGAKRQVDQICDEFERAWQEGRRRPIEEYLRNADAAILACLREELLRQELNCRFQRGEQLRAEDYLERFPECAGALPRWLEEAAATVYAPKAPAPAGVPSTASQVPNAETPSPLPIEPNDKPLPTVLGEYELLERLGAGGMGEVYRARHRRLGKLVALKVIRKTDPYAAEALARFRREMEAVGTLDHPHLVEAQYAGEQDGVLYLVMKLIDGVDLHELVKQRGPLPSAEACELIRQAALGLQYLHEHRLVHRDIKPSNLMRTPTGTVKVLDLGLARFRSGSSDQDLTQPNMMMGTPGYLAPEQILNAANVDIRADLYGLGATFFYLLTGRDPFSHHHELQAKLTGSDKTAGLL